MLAERIPSTSLLAVSCGSGAGPRNHRSPTRTDPKVDPTTYWARSFWLHPIRLRRKRKVWQLLRIGILLEPLPSPDFNVALWRLLAHQQSGLLLHLGLLPSLPFHCLTSTAFHLKKTFHRAAAIATMRLKGSKTRQRTRDMMRLHRGDESLLLSPAGLPGRLFLHFYPYPVGWSTWISNTGTTHVLYKRRGLVWADAMLFT